MGTAGDTGRARNLMLLCGPNGTGRHYALTCAVEEPVSYTHLDVYKRQSL